ncbi:MAG TPA: OB-fold domain-containing protein [Steroidobacteraceae bacterium]|nr:OB-fold domain-containing protein [Steroidobacteraceae bacterium]
MSGAASIVSCGLYVPQWRMERARIAEALAWLEPPGAPPASGARAVCNWDEDALTMAVEAGRRCMADVQQSTPTALSLASTTLPFADRSNATLVAEALDLPDSIRTSDRTGSLRAGTTALAEAVSSGDDAPTLVIASDSRMGRPGSRAEMEYGAAAVALLISRDPRASGREPMATLTAAAHVAADFVDHYRMSGANFDYALEERWVRDEGAAKLIPAAVGRALALADISPSSIDHFAMPGPAGTVRRVAQAAGIGHARVSEGLREECGDTGTTQPLLLLLAMLAAASPGQRLLLIGFGQGVDALVLDAGVGAAALAQRELARALARARPELHYTRYLAHRGLLAPDFGMRAERDQRTAQSVAWRKHRELAAFIGGRCGSCGAVQFPKSRVCVNPVCRRTDTQADHRLAGSVGRVRSFTEDWQAYTPHPPYIYGNIGLEAGGNLLMELTDVEPGELEVGSEVKFVFRIKDCDTQRAYRRYFWKATRA